MALEPPQSMDDLIILVQNLHDHFHLNKKTHLTQDEYKICESLLSSHIDIHTLFRGLIAIYKEIQSMSGIVRMSRRE